MDYSKIRLNNERNSHVTKRLNRLNTWNFFKVLYRENIMRLFGFSLLMLIFMAPIAVVMFLGSMRNNNLLQTLPTLNGFGFSTGVWQGLGDYYQGRVNLNNFYTGLLCVAASLVCSLIFSGGFAVIRDAFWTGKLSTVGVFKSLGKGIKAGVVYALICTLVLGFSVLGAYEFYVWASVAWPLWLAIVLLVLICIVIMFLAIYAMILCSVAVTYKQSVYENLDDAWRLMWLNILPNIIHFLLALIPVALYFAFSGSTLFTIFLVLILMFGGMYFPLVWQTHMMKTFALFHPVEVKKKKSQNKKAQTAEEPQEGSKKQSKGKKAAKDELLEGEESAEDVETVDGETATDEASDATDEVTETDAVEEALAVDGVAEAATEETAVTDEGEDPYAKEE